MKREALLALSVLAVLVAAAALWLSSGRKDALRVAGLEPGMPVPMASPGMELMLPEALEAARTEAGRSGARALLVHRRGHRVFAWFAAGLDGNTQVGGGDLAAAVLSLTLHEPGQASEVAAPEAAALVSQRLWQPLRAADGWLTDGGARPWHCCMRARIDDWMRVGDLLLGGGAYLGERLIDADAVRQFLAGHTVPQWQGDEPPAAADATAFDLEPGMRLWMSTRRQLAILVWAGTDAARDTLVPNIILRGLNDQAPAISGDSSDIVPGH
jgi:hypothetical protein